MDNVSIKKHEAKFSIEMWGISLTLLKNQYQMRKKIRKNNLS